MPKFIQKDAVINLIREGNFGHYQLFAYPGGELVAGSHQGEEKIFKVDELIENLDTKLDYLGSGQYKIALKNNLKSQNSYATVYHFQVGEGFSGNSALQGLGMPAAYNGVEKSLEQRLTEQMARFEEKMRYEKQIWDLQRQMEDLKRKPGSKEAPEWAKGIIDLAKMLGVVVIQKYSPESMKMAQAVMGMEEGDEEPVTGDNFQRTD